MRPSSTMALYGRLHMRSGSGRPPTRPGWAPWSRKPRAELAHSRRRGETAHQPDLGGVDVRRFDRHGQRANSRAEVSGDAVLERCELDQVHVALGAEVDRVRVDGEL